MEWIDKIVVGILEYYETNNPYEILYSMDINIIKVDKSNPLLMCKSCIFIAEFNTIYIKDDLILSHELFFLRHELGHVLLHIDATNTYIVNNGKIERQANYFAFKLSSIKINEIELYEMTLEQISCSIKLPQAALKQLINI